MQSIHQTINAVSYIHAKLNISFPSSVQSVNGNKEKKERNAPNPFTRLCQYPPPTRVYPAP